MQYVVEILDLCVYFRDNQQPQPNQILAEKNPQGFASELSKKLIKVLEAKEQEPEIDRRFKERIKQVSEYINSYFLEEVNY